MRWRLLQEVTELVPERSIAGRAATDFPPELYADHFPSWPVTPGVLLVEIGAQLGGLLLQATVLEREGRWVFPVLSIIREAKFWAPVPPGADLRVEAELESLAADGAVCRARLFLAARRCAAARLVYSFDPDGRPAGGDPALLREQARAEYRRLGSPWEPRAV